MSQSSQHQLVQVNSHSDAVHKVPMQSPTSSAHLDTSACPEPQLHTALVIAPICLPSEQASRASFPSAKVRGPP